MTKREVHRLCDRLVSNNSDLTNVDIDVGELSGEDIDLVVAALARNRIVETLRVAK